MANDKTPLHIRGFLKSPTVEVSPFLLNDGRLVDCLGCDPTWYSGELRKDTGYVEDAGFAPTPLLTVNSYFGGVKAVAVQ